MEESGIYQLFVTQGISLDNLYQTTIKLNCQKIIHFVKSRKDNQGKNNDDDDDDDDDDGHHPGPSGGGKPTSFIDIGMDTVDNGGREVTSPHDDDDDQTSLISSASGTKRRSSLQESSVRPQKRATRSHTETEGWPSLNLNSQGKISVTNCMQVIQCITQTTLTDRLKKKEKILGLFSWKIADTLKINANISASSDNIYLQPTVDAISILSQGNSNIIVTHHPHSKLKKEASKLSVPIQILAGLVSLNSELLHVTLGQLILSIVCTFLQWGLNGTRTWTSQVIVSQATPDMRYIFDQISTMNQNQEIFYQDCFLTCSIQKVATMLFDLQTESVN
jgi:hypothetical protein